MGSDASLLVFARDPEPLADWAVGEIERLEQCWSRFRPDSELGALNRGAGVPDVIVSATLACALERARVAYELTEGRFDPTILPVLQTLGYDRTFTDVAAHGNRCRERAPVPGFRDVLLERSSSHGARVARVTLPRGTAIDLGGIGKGLAADLVTEGLLARGASSVCVSLGGDLRVAGPGPDDDASWRVSIEDARTGTVRFDFPLVDEAIAQSTTVLRRWTRDGRELHHIVDPHQADCAATDVESAVVTAPSAWQADVLATAAIIAGARDGVALLERAGVDGWLFGRDGHMAATPAVRDAVSFTGGTSP
jgi:thiamine biosynthesis lipoprotein